MIVATTTDAASINAAVKANLDQAGGETTLTVDLEDAATGLATHRWCSSLLTSAGVFGDATAGTAGLLQLAPNFPSARGYVWCVSGGSDLMAQLEQAFVGAPNVSVGEISGQQVLDDLGLRVPAPAETLP